MNPSNYCTLPIAKRLHEEGIVVETDMAWKPYRYDASKKEYFDWRLTPTNQTVFQGQEGYPAPNLSEVIRQFTSSSTFVKVVMEREQGYYNNCWPEIAKRCVEILSNIDDACELLMWVKGEK